MRIGAPGRGAKQQNHEPTAHFSKPSIKNELQPDSQCLSPFFKKKITQFKTFLICPVTLYINLREILGLG